MRRSSCIFLCVFVTLLFAVRLLPQATPAQPAPAKKAAPKSAGPAAMTNRDVLKLLQAKFSEDIIISKIKQSKTNFDTSVDALVALRTAGATDRLITFMMDPTAAPAPAAAAAPAAAPELAAPKYTGPATNREHDAAATTTAPAVKSEASRPIIMTAAPENFGVYIVSQGKMQPLGRIQTKVQVSKFRTLLKSYVRFVRSKIDINIPGAHSSSRFELIRPTFYAYFPPSRDVSKFKLLQCKITGQKFDQRTVANASIMFSTEQNQDEVPIDIGPAGIRQTCIASSRAKIFLLVNSPLWKATPAANRLQISKSSMSTTSASIARKRRCRSRTISMHDRPDGNGLGVPGMVQGRLQRSWMPATATPGSLAA